MGEQLFDGHRGERLTRAAGEVKLLSKAGLDWTWRFPWIVETAKKMKASRFVIDGEICVLDVQGISDFDALHSGQHNDEAELYAFDVIELNGADALACSTRPPGARRLLVTMEAFTPNS